MNITVTARHCSVSERVRSLADEGIRGLTRFHPDITGAELTFDGDGNGNQLQAEAIVQVPGTRIVASSSALTARAALDALLERLARQLKRDREQRVERHGARPVEEIAAGETD